MNINTLLTNVRADWQRRTPQSCAKPQQLVVDEVLYEQLRAEAAKHGVSAPAQPVFEEDRLEHKGIKVYLQREPGAKFLPEPFL